MPAAFRYALPKLAAATRGSVLRPMPLDANHAAARAGVLKALLAKELSPKTAVNILVVLKEMLKHAAQWGYPDANPVQYAERPRGEEQDMQILTPPEIRRSSTPRTSRCRRALWQGKFVTPKARRSRTGFDGIRNFRASRRPRRTSKKSNGTTPTSRPLRAGAIRICPVRTDNCGGGGAAGASGRRCSSACCRSRRRQ